MQTAPTEVQQIEISIDKIHAKIKLAEDLDKLHRSPAFKNVFLKGYFETKAQNLVSMTALPSNDAQEQVIKNGMLGISALQSHFRSIFKDGEEAADTLEAYTAEHTMAINEEEG